MQQVPFLLQAILLTPIYILLIAVILQPILSAWLILAAATTWFLSTIGMGPESEGFKLRENRECMSIGKTSRRRPTKLSVAQVPEVAPSQAEWRTLFW